jgi:hypothetical protein
LVAYAYAAAHAADVDKRVLCGCTTLAADLEA